MDSPVPILYLTSSDYEESTELRVTLRAVELFSVWVTIDPRVEYAVRISVRAAMKSAVRCRVLLIDYSEAVKYVCIFAVWNLPAFVCLHKYTLKYN